MVGQVQKKHSLNYGKIYGEKSSADLEAAKKYIADTDNLIKDTRPKNIYMLMKMAILETFSDITIVKKGKKYAGEKLFKEKLSILFTVSWAGEKLKPLK